MTSLTRVHPVIGRKNNGQSVLDAVLFLLVAGFVVTPAAVGGQFLVETVWVTALFLLAAEGVRRALPHQRQQTTSALTSAGHITVEPGRARRRREMHVARLRPRGGLRDILDCQGVALFPGWAS
jgi:hypothetical protein